MTATETLALEGGIPVRDLKQRPWPTWPIFDENEERALLEVLHSGQWWYVDGVHGVEFEKEFARFQGARYGVACTNGTAALEIGLRAMGIGCGDEVIVPPYTFIATATAVLTVGATPVFVDIEGDTLNIDPAQIEAAITHRTRAVIPAYIAGRPADLDAILDIARRRNLRVIEDAAQAHGAEWNGRKVGALGDLGTFSFQASKNLNAGEGGLIVSNDEGLADAAWSVMNVGRVRSGRWYQHQVLGGNYRITEFQTAILRTQLQRLPDQIARRTASADRLTRLLNGISGISLPRHDPRITVHANHLFPFRYDAAAFGGKPITDFVAALKYEGIPCSTGYGPLYKEAVFARHASREGSWCQVGRQIDYPHMHLPVCEAVCADCVWLQQHLLLGSSDDMDDIATAIAKIARAWNGK
jgi:dTDP-4-amino-4,6-dideoxygalactose transaminase